METTGNPIKFKFIYPDSEPGGWGSIEDPSPYFHLSDPRRSLSEMLNPNEIVITNPSITIVFDYPLRGSFRFPFVSEGGFTRRKLAKVIAKQYARIYEEEQRTTDLPIETISEREHRLGTEESELKNRAGTDGTYGIWGHVLSDLVLHTVYFNPEENVYFLGIDS